MNNPDISSSMNISLDSLFKKIPKMPSFSPKIRRAPKRYSNLSKSDSILALKNALRYIPPKWHEQLAPEFLSELHTHGRIYGYRFRPPGQISGKNINQYRGKCLEGRAFQVMIDNNLDFEIALYPYELVTYGETGQVCQNWMQYLLIKQYLKELTEQQTLVVQSGHPLGLFTSSIESPRTIITNALMVGAFDDQENWRRAAAIGVANYGQMTAGGWMYIGPQGIVHGTYNTVLNAARSKFRLAKDDNLAGILFISSGLGGMSGAQGKAVKIAGGISIIAEVDQSRISLRHSQGWIDKVLSTPETAFAEANLHIQQKSPAALAYFGNIVDLLQYAVINNIQIPLLSDQTSCHAAYEGGYCPQGLRFEQRTKMLSQNRSLFAKQVDISLKQHYHLINQLVNRGTYFFDYGNSFLKAVYDTGVTEVCKNKNNPLDGFIFPSYVEDIMGPLLFDYGYGPFRWVCLSGDKNDLEKTDHAAMACINPDNRFQDRDNYNWIRDASKNKLVVGTLARILYQDAQGRTDIALAFNKMIRNKEIGPIMIGRDHHDTGGTDSPYRETANIKDGSNIMAEMATHCFAGNAARGMSLVALHNGGGVGIGNAINGGFGLVLDGSHRVDDIIKRAICWDVMGGVARRSWAGNKNAMEVSALYNQTTSGNDHITLPFQADENHLAALVSEAMKQEKLNN